MRSLFLWMALSLTLATGALAQITTAPSLMNFQGRLTKPDGTPVADGNYALRFSLYDALTGGNEIWNQTVNSVSVKNGTFAALLSGFAANTFAGDLWLEIKIGADAPLTPRQPLVSVAYAMKANSVPDDSITSASLADNTITAADLLSDSQSLSKVSGGALLLNSDRLFVPNGVIQRGGSALTGTQDLGLYSQVSGNWMRFVTNNAPFRWYADSGIGTNALMTLTPQGRLGLGTSNPSSTLHIVGGQLGISNAAANKTLTFGYESAPDHFSARLGSLNEIFTINALTGHVGIGTTNTHNKLSAEIFLENRCAIVGLNFAASGQNSHGVIGRTASPEAYGVYGHADSNSGYAVGVYGQSDAVNGNGVFGRNDSATGWGVRASGRLAASGTKSFLIDHPADPQNKYLAHYCAEGPEPLNIYSGNVTTDQNGEAWVTLPAYFEQINRDIRYALTVVDGSDSPEFVQVKVALKVANGRFKIRASAPHVEVSWEVKAVRNDRYVQRYGAPVEVEKSALERGRYQHPELYNQPVERGIGYRPLTSRNPK